LWQGSGDVSGGGGIGRVKGYVGGVAGYVEMWQGMWRWWKLGCWRDPSPQVSGIIYAKLARYLIRPRYYKIKSHS